MRNADVVRLRSQAIHGRVTFKSGRYKIRTAGNMEFESKVVSKKQG